MLMVISPSKSLNASVARQLPAVGESAFLDRAEELVTRLRQLSPAEIANLMEVSDALAQLNFQRYEAWHRPFSLHNAQPAVLAFSGDVYEGLDALSLSDEDLAFAQRHLRILSGLYGILRPCDLMQAYRLEMGCRLANEQGKDLYAFWGDRLRQAVEAELAAMPRPVLVNLASDEYFKALQPKKLGVRVIQPVFEEWKGGRYRIISFFAKRARGLMARHAILNRLEGPEGMQDFAAEGYRFAPEASDEHSWVFRRRQDGL